MEPLVEVVPNVSEGSRMDVIEAMADAIDGTHGAWLLDRTSDPDHGRSVLTMAGSPAAAAEAMDAIVRLAIERIDMRAHRGQHPRLGALDVVPFVPLQGVTLRGCAGLAREFGARIADRYDVPVFLYGEAAQRPDRRVLADIRRPGFEGLATSMTEPGGAPDFGPLRPHPTAGAVAVGARPILIAYNVQLATSDLATARRVAAAIREKGGGLPRVQALGLYLASEGRVQVSMNVLDHTVTPLWRVWEEVGRLAEAEGVQRVDSELVGLAPKAAFEAVRDHIGAPVEGDAGAWLSEAAAWLRLRDFSPEMVLESRLGHVLDAAADTRERKI